jgi:hypothetical protein
MSKTPADDSVNLIERARAAWRFRGRQRPDFAIEPGPGQESVWDYPRPPAVVPEPRLVEVRAAERSLAASGRAVRVCETGSPPTIYLPPEDVAMDLLVVSPNLDPAVERPLECVPRGVRQGATRRRSGSTPTRCNAVGRRAGRAPGVVAAITRRVSPRMTVIVKAVKALHEARSGQLPDLG